MQQSRRIALLTVALTVAAPSVLVAGDTSAFDRMAGSYETVRQALLNDSMTGVDQAAGHILRELDGLGRDLTGDVAGIHSGSEDDLRALLPGLRAAVTGLRRAETIEAARESFAEVSKAMVRYRRLVPQPGVVVAFCPMAQKVWLQPEGEIGNPYHGQRMARCGEVVSE